VRSTSQRGVCMVATAHGVDLRSVLSNVELKSLLGGVASVTLGDKEARETNGGQKTRTEQTGAPTFTSAVEVLAVDRWGWGEDVGAGADIISQFRKIGKETQESCQALFTGHLQWAPGYSWVATVCAWCIWLARTAGGAALQQVSRQQAY
jgi:hypothetical protein